MTKSRLLDQGILATLVATLGFFCLGQLGRIELQNSQSSFYLYELPLSIAVVLLTLKYRFLPFLKKNSLVKSLFIFVGILLTTLAFSFFYFSLQDSITAAMYFLRLVFYLLFFVYLRHHSLANQKLVKALYPYFVAAIAVHALFGILQYFLYPDLRNLIYEGWDPHLYRVFGTFFEPAIAAAWYAIAVIFLLHKKLRTSISLSHGLIVVLSALILLSYSRSAYVAGIITCFVYLGRNNIKKTLLIFTLCLFIIMLLPKPAGEGVNLLRSSTVVSRATDLTAGLKVARDHLLTGIGYNHIRSVKYSADSTNHAASGYQSSFLIILVTSGIFGLVAFLYFLYQMCLLHPTLKYIVLFLSSMSLFDNVLLHPFMLFTLGIYGALLINLSRE